MIQTIRSAISPAVVLCLTALWLVLQQTIAPGPDPARDGARTRCSRPRARNFVRCMHACGASMPALALILVVLWEIVQSNIAVARVVLGLRAQS